jgi:hypothetical protein
MAIFMCSFLVRSLSAAGFICHIESPMIIRAGCTPVHGDFMCSFLVRSLSAAGFICHIESPMIIRAGCTPVRGDFICSFLVRRLSPAFFICHMDPNVRIPNTHFRSLACLKGRGGQQLVGISYSKTIAFHEVLSIM